MYKTFTVSLLSLALASPALASPSAQMRVSVEVVARTILTVDQQPASVVITAADVAQGYVEIPSAIAFHVRSNARNGFALQFLPVSGPFASASLSWGNASVSVGSDASWLMQPYQRGLTTGTFDVRLTLAPAAAPGTYAWPVSIDAESR